MTEYCRAPALWARPVDGEPTLSERDGASTPALGTGGPGRAGCPARAGAGGAGLVYGERNRDLATEHRYTKRDLNNRLERIADRLLTSAAPEDGREDVAEATEIAEIDSFIGGPTRGACHPSSARRPGTRTTWGAVERAVPAHTVVLGALLRIRQGRVRLGNFLEALRGFRIVRVGVGVILLGEPAVGFLDVVLACRVRHAEDLVEVLRGHVTLDPALSTPEPSPGGPASPCTGSRSGTSRSLDGLSRGSAVG